MPITTKTQKAFPQRLQEARVALVDHILVDCRYDRGDALADCMNNLAAIEHDCVMNRNLPDRDLGGSNAALCRRYFRSTLIADDDVTYDHLIPSRTLRLETRARFGGHEISDDTVEEVSGFVKRFTILCGISQKENQALRDARLNQTMPDGWQFATDNPWARYSEAGIFANIQYIGDGPHPWEEDYPGLFPLP